MTQLEEEAREKKISLNMLETSENYNETKSLGVVLSVEQDNQIQKFRCGFVPPHSSFLPKELHCRAQLQILSL